MCKHTALPRQCQKSKKKNFIFFSINENNLIFQNKKDITTTQDMIEIVKEKLQKCDENLSSLKNCAFELNHEFSHINEKVNSLDKSLKTSDSSTVSGGGDENESHIEKILETFEQRNAHSVIAQPIKQYTHQHQFNSNSKRLSSQSANEENASELSDSDYTSSSSDESSDDDDNDYDCHYADQHQVEEQEEDVNHYSSSKPLRQDRILNDNCNKLIKMLLHNSGANK